MAPVVGAVDVVVLVVELVPRRHRFGNAAPVPGGRRFSVRCSLLGTCMESVSVRRWLAKKVELPLSVMLISRGSACVSGEVIVFCHRYHSAAE
jgi:hypothetical protein